MTATVTPDYGLTGAARQHALEGGLASASWFRPEIDPARLRALQARSDGRAAFDTLLWIALVIGSGLLAWWSWRSWWSIPAFAVYGALHGGAADPRWHECGHGTAFKSRWANDAVYPVASMMLFRGPTVWRWSHFRHHTDTIIVGRDPEITFMRPASVWATAFKFTHLQGGSLMFWRLVKHAFGKIDDDARDFVPEPELGKVKWEARIAVAIVAGAAVWSIVAWTPLPILFVGGPSIYGAWLLVFFGVTQHAGLREDVLDHRLNTRTVYMNPIFRFLYLNMNYHVEHHIFPSVPYHALPKLHEEIKDQLAPPLPSTWAAYRHIWSTLWRQQHDHAYEAPLALPEVRVAPRPIVVGADAWTALAPEADVEGSADQPAAATAAATAGGGLDAVDLGPVEAVPLGDLQRVDVGDRTFVLCRLDDGRVTLLDGLCTHEAVHLCDGLIADGQIECPMHNGCFDVATGAPTRYPATEPLRRYDVEVVDGRVRSRLERQP